MITFKGTSLKEWIAEVGGTEELGVTFGVNIGPFPRAPTDNTINTRSSRRCSTSTAR